MTIGLFGIKVTVTKADQYSIKATVPFEILQGEVSSKKNITLNLNEVNGIEVLGPDLKSEMSGMLKESFSNLPAGYN